MRSHSGECDPPAASGARDRPPLLVALERIQKGGNGYRFALLRESPLGEAAIGSDDLDLLGGRRDVEMLVTHLDVMCRELGIDLFMARTGPRKTRVSLYSGDQEHGLHLDLWVDLWQLAGGRRSLRWRDIAPLCGDDERGLVRMPLRLEVAVYLEHLRARKRSLDRPLVRARLEQYAASLVGSEGHDDGLADAMASVAASPPSALPQELVDRASAIIDRALHGRHRLRAPWRRLEDVLRRGRARLLAPPRGARAIALIGPDGVGKSTIGRALVSAEGGWQEYLVGKSLYRRSLPFRALYKLNRMTGDRLSQERIDETLSGLAYIVAIVRLRRRLAASGGRGLVIDRFLADFLYVGRKGERPHFSRWLWLVHAVYVSLPVIHLTAPHAVLSTRKQEISDLGLVRFERDMTRFYARLPRVHYLRFVNTGSREEAICALRRHLTQLEDGDET